ncbi:MULTISPECIES: hypothetical protein [unclassified Streptomyces]|uniref:hypothetical protein n=1 Tax=unclassified Streptomyces TaxID=2593676 RepID=UPI0036EE5646
MTIDKDALEYAWTKIYAVASRPGLPAITSEVQIVRAAAHHANCPWSATTDLHAGSRQVVVVAEKAIGTEIVDQLQDRLRRRTYKAARSGDTGHQTTVPPWRGGQQSV